MAFLAPLGVEAGAMLGPAVMSGAEQLGASLIGKEALGGLKKLANFGMREFSKEVSPSHILHKIVNKGAKVLQDPNQVRNVIHEGQKVMGIATRGAHTLGENLHKYGIISEHQAGKWRSSLGKVNHGFHHHLGKLGKIHGHLLPFLKK